MLERKHFRTCPICEACCGLIVTTDTAGAVTSVKGDPDDPFSRGFVCPKSQAVMAVADDPDRLTSPLFKENGAFREIGWDEAFDIAAARLRAVRDRNGPDTVAFYMGNPMGNNPGLAWFSGALVGQLQTRQIYTASSIDAFPRMLTNSLMYGNKSLLAVPDVDHCDYLLIIGANPAVSNGSLLTAPGMPRRLRAIKARGGTIVVVDPRRSETAQIADRHLSIRPATDALLLFAMIHTLFEEGLVGLGAHAEVIDGMEAVRAAAAAFAPETVAVATTIPAEDIRRLARELAGAERAAVYGRVGACCQVFGTLTSWLTDVVNILTGNLDRRGGVVFSHPIPSPAIIGDPYVGDQAPFDRYRTRVRGFPEFSRQFPCFVLAEEIAEPGPGRVRALVTLSGNPVLSFANGPKLERAIGTLDFMLAVDPYLNETTCHADLVLPPIGHLHRSGFTQHFTNFAVRTYVKHSPAVLDRPTSGFDDWEIMIEIASRIGETDRATCERDFMRSLVARVTSEALPDLDAEPEAILDSLEGETPPDRIFDLLIRVGAYGDQLGHRQGGLSLSALREHPHGLDLGPAPEGLLASKLRTPDRRIHLAPQLMLDDVPRLASALSDGTFADPSEKNEFVLTSRRDTRSMNSWLHNARPFAKGRDRCTLIMHPDDARSLGLCEGDLVKASNALGEVVVPLEFSDEVRRRAVNLPHGFGHDAPGARLNLARVQPGANINVLLSEEVIDQPSGNMAFNAVRVKVEAA